ncbi:Uncharacterised protein [uncultured archaeon]|nr:Uncharacterised protein [uncultured archaeon]
MAKNSTIVHLEVGEPLKIAMQSLVDRGLFGTMSDVIRDGIRHVLLEYNVTPPGKPPGNAGVI